MGLIVRRNETHCSSRLDLMSEWFARVTFVNAYPLTCAIMPTLEKILILFGARAEGDKERPRLQNLSGKLSDQVVALLRYQPRNYRNDWAVRFFRQAKATEEVKLAR